MASTVSVLRPYLLRLFSTVIGIAVAMVVSKTSLAQTPIHQELPTVCRATVAAMMGHDISIVSLDKVDSDIAYVYYNRPSDGKLWKNRCRIQGSQIIWGTVDAFGPGTGFGRWRNDPADEVVTYLFDGREITIVQTFSDGSKITKTFAVKK